MASNIYRFRWNCGRMGFLEGLFIADEKEVEAAIGQKVYFGEVLGKHSEIYGTLQEGDIELLVSDPAVVQALSEATDGPEICGYSPLEYLDEEEDDEWEDEEEEWKLIDEEKNW